MAARAGGQSPEATVSVLRGIADRNPQYLPVHLFLAQSYAQLGRIDEAAATAMRVSHRMPRVAEPPASRKSAHDWLSDT